MKLLLSITIILLVVGCAQIPSIQQGPDAEKTYDGLVRIDHARFSNAWIDPDVDLSQYRKIMVGNAEFEFRAVKKSNSSSMARRSNETEFWMGDKERETLIEIVSAAFRGELEKSKNFTFADGPGPDVLIIVGGLHDIVSRVPPDMVGRGETYLSSVGEATLVLEARDSPRSEQVGR